MMESVYCNCRKCDSTVGLFVNLWTRIGKSYFSPVVDPGNDVAVRPEGAIRVGEPGTLVDEWYVFSSKPARQNHSDILI